MKHVLLAWELGAAFGHLAQMRRFAHELRSLGATTEFAVRDLDGAGQFLDASLGRLQQAPLTLADPATPLTYQTSYASVLYQCGWSDSAGLAARLRAWCTLIERSGCDLLVADHSPTALLAARLLGVPTAMIGTGFALPPPVQPFPAFNPADPELLRSNEAALLTLANAALATIAAKPLPSLQALFEGAIPGLFTYAELDPFAPRAQADYLGAPAMSLGDTVQWGARREPRLFGYLRPFPGLPALLEALARLPVQVLLRVAGVTPAALAAYRRPGLVIVDHAVQMQQVLDDCDLCISHGSHGVTAEMLLAGKPGVLLPEHREHELYAESVQRLGAGESLSIAGDVTVGHHEQMLRKVLDDPAYTLAARRFATRYAGHSRDAALNGWCAALLR